MASMAQIEVAKQRYMSQIGSSFSAIILYNITGHSRTHIVAAGVGAAASDLLRSLNGQLPPRVPANDRESSTHLFVIMAMGTKSYFEWQGGRTLPGIAFYSPFIACST